jgi:hypothetical protein
MRCLGRGCDALSHDCLCFRRKFQPNEWIYASDHADRIAMQLAMLDIQDLAPMPLAYRFGVLQRFRR